MKLKTPVFRVSYPESLFEGKPDKHGKPVYSLNMIFDTGEIAKDPEQQKLFKALLAAIDQVGKDAFPGKKIPPLVKKGEDKTDASGNRVDGYADGTVWWTARTKVKPAIVPANNTKARITDPQELYAGCYAHATVIVKDWTYQEEGGVRTYGVRTMLCNVQKVKDGVPFSSAGSPEDDFDALTVEPDVMTADDLIA